MKNFIKLFLFGLLISTQVSCESDDEVYNGSPVGKNDIVTLEGHIETSIDAAMLNQKIPFTIHLPRKFSDTVSVEVSTTNRSGVSTRVSVDLMPNEDTKSDEIPCAGGALYDSQVDMQITAIVLKKVEPGIHYLIKSNVITLETGDTPVPASDNSKLQVRFAWPQPGSTLNNIRLTVVKPDNTTVLPGLSGGYRTYSIANKITGPGSAIVGEYLFKINAQGLITSPVDLPYRFVVRFPNGSSQLVQGVYQALTTASPQRTVLKVTKTYNITTNVASYEVTDQGL